MMPRIAANQRTCRAPGLVMSQGASWLLFTTLVCLCSVAPSHAQQTGILSQEPFDIITLNEQNQSRVLRTMPLDFPGRKIPSSPNPNSRLRIRLLNNPNEEFEVAWNGIAKIELFEQRVLREAQRLIRSRRFDDAFEHLSFVRNNYPDTPGLDATVSMLLFAEASVLYRERKLERAVLLLNEIYERNPDRRNLTNALTRVLQALFDSKVSEDDFQEARRIYGIAEQRYGSRLPELLTKWQRTLQSTAEKAIADSRSQLNDGDYRSAYTSSRKALSIWPDTPGLRELVAETSRRYPLLTVGVMQPHGESSDHPMFNWAQRRTSRLRLRRLFELNDVGPDGSQYECPVGDATVPDDGRSFSIKLFEDGQSAEGFLGMAVSRRLLELANPLQQDYDPAWAMLVRQVSLASISEVEVDLRRPYLRVQGLLNIPAVGEQNPAVQLRWEPYQLVVDEAISSEQRFVVNPNYTLATTTQPREIVERVFANSQQAVRSLRRGEIDVLDRIFPADITQLKRDNEVVVTAYRIPSLHALIPNQNRSYSSSRIFRRAMAYAIDRKKILERDLLGGSNIPGCRLLSGPFPIGTSSDDPIGYAYDPTIEPLAYDPRHAKTLVQLAQVELQTIARKKEQPAPKLDELIVVHPPSEVARVACREMVEDLKVIGIPCALKELAAGQTRPTDEEWDFLYLDYLMGEPLVDARRLLASDGFAACSSPHLNLAIRQLDDVISWNDAGRRLRAIHQISYDDMSIVPLWQLNDHLARHKLVDGSVAQPVTTYQDIEAWKVVPAE